MVRHSRLAFAIVMATLAASLLGSPVQANEKVHFGRTLQYGTPRQAGLLAEHVARIAPDAAAFLQPTAGSSYPFYPGFVVLAARHGVIVEHTAGGHALRYAGSGGTELPHGDRIPMREDTLFDMASISKLFTAVVTMQLVERGLTELDAPVARYIPEFASNGKQAVTLRHLLTHTAGLPAGLNLNPYPTVPQRLEAIYAVPARTVPGTSYLYSDLSLIVVGKVLERATGKPLDQLVREGISQPLNLRDTMHNPPTSLRPRIAMAAPSVVGHTGFTGTSVVIDPETGAFVILLTNRVQPTRAWAPDIGQARRAVAGDLARAIAVHPAQGRTAWFADNGPEAGAPRTATLTLPIGPQDGPMRLESSLWWDIETCCDRLTIETASEGVSGWTPLTLTLRAGTDTWVSGGQIAGAGRSWHRASAVLPAGTSHVRWRYTTDNWWLGRGVYVDAVRISAAGRVVFEDNRPADHARWQADGFHGVRIDGR